MYPSMVRLSVMSNSFGTPWIVVHQAPLSMGFPRQESWSGLPFPSVGDLPDPGIKSTSPVLAGGFFTVKWSRKPKTHYAAAAAAKSLQSCPTLCNPMDCSPLGSSVHGILQARILEWVAISSSRGSSRPRDGTRVSCIGRRVLYH